MGKLERKKEVIEKYISKAGGNWSAWSYGNIPSLRLKNACYEYVGAVETSSILGLIDITVSGNGKKGMVFTEHKVYFNNGFLGSKGSVSYQSIYDDGFIPSEVLDSYYNTAALKELLSDLANIEGQSMQDTLNDWGDAVNQGVDAVANTIDNVVNVIDKATDIFARLYNWANSDQDSNKDINALEDKNNSADNIDVIDDKNEF